MKNDPLLIWIIWPPRQYNFAEIRNQLQNYLRLLHNLHRDFESWVGISTNGCMPVQHDLPDLDTRLRQLCRPNSDQRSDFTALDANFDVTDSSMGRFGFDFSLSTLKLYPEGQKSCQPEPIDLRISTSSVGVNIFISLPRDRDRDLVSVSGLKRLLTASLEYWNGNLAQVFSSGFASALEQQHPARIGELRAVWMCYARHSLLAECIKPDIPCMLERVRDDGLLFTLTEHCPDPSKQTDVNLAMAVQAKFDEFHFNHPFVYHGWPYDPDEARYAAQITGAPEGMAYAVGFAAFDGYDAKRDVLLSAHLFKFPPGWEPDLHPIYITNAERLESLPYVVLARHQIAAVRYVGADTPIEWHIGIAKHADILKVLINDWAAIPSEQLRVVYTPSSNPSCNS
jgi:hypothetical protein